MTMALYTGENYTGTPWQGSYGITSSLWELDFYLTTTNCPGPIAIPALPKSWHWYDIFRSSTKPKLLRLVSGHRSAMHRTQERYPLAQRARRKRRAYVQRLRAGGG